MSYYYERAAEYDEVCTGKGPASVFDPDAYAPDVRRIGEIASGFGKGRPVDIACGTVYGTCPFPGGRRKPQQAMAVIHPVAVCKRPCMRRNSGQSR